MSFVLELLAPVRSWEEAERAARVTRGDGFVSVVPGRRKRLWRELKPSIHFDGKDVDEVLGDEADWEESAFSFSASGSAALAATVLALREALGPGWAIRAYWMGDAQEAVVEVAADELAALVRQSKLDRGTLYRVRSSS